VISGSVCGAEPAFFRHIEDDAVRVLELSLEVLLLLVGAKIKEKISSCGFDAALRFGNVVDLKTEMMGADEAFGVIEARAALAESSEVELLLSDPF
jgi:hypothetical protein